MVFIMKTTPLHSPNRSQLRRDSFLPVFGRRLALPLFFLCAALLMQPCAATPFQWEFTGNLNVARDYHTATLLSDGRVLAASGSTNGPQDLCCPEITSAELYDQTTGTWALTGSLTDARVLHTAALLLNGQVLVAGGWPNHNHTGGALATAELYDPATGTWSLTGSTTTPHFGFHTATLLPNGMVLVAGGYDGNLHISANAELYDPATGTWTATGSVATARQEHTATLLANGK